MPASLEHFPPKHALDPIGGGCYFGVENAAIQESERLADSLQSQSARACLNIVTEVGATVKIRLCREQAPSQIAGSSRPWGLRVLQAKASFFHRRTQGPRLKSGRHPRREVYHPPTGLRRAAPPE